jgi:dihydroorotate dehydrogenase
VLNVSSPNTPDLRKLQDEDRLRELLGAVSAANRARDGQPGKTRKPLLLKIAPDLTSGRSMRARGHRGVRLDGIIATNTTLARPGAFARSTRRAD